VLGFKDNQGGPLSERRLFIGEAQYRRALAGAGYVPEAFEAAVREQALLEKLNRFFTDATFVSDAEVEEDFATRTVKAKIEYALLPPPPAMPGAVTDADAERSSSRTAQYLAPEKRKAKYLLVESAKVKTTLTVSDADIQNEYNANLETYKKGERSRPATSSTRWRERTMRWPGQRRGRRPEAQGGGRLRGAGEGRVDDPGSKANAAISELRARADGEGVRGRGLRRGPEADRRPGQERVRLPRDPGLEKSEPRAQTPLRGGPGDPRTPPRPARSRRGETPGRELYARVAKISRPSDEDLRKLAAGNVTFNETEFLARSDAAAGLGPNPEFGAALFALKPGESPHPSRPSAGGDPEARRDEEGWPARLRRGEAARPRDLARKSRRTPPSPP